MIKKITMLMIVLLLSLTFVFNKKVKKVSASSTNDLIKISNGDTDIIINDNEKKVDISMDFANLTATINNVTIGLKEQSYLVVPKGKVIKIENVKFTEGSYALLVYHMDNNYTIHDYYLGGKFLKSGGNPISLNIEISKNEDINIIKYGFSSIDWEHKKIVHNIPLNPLDDLDLFVPQYNYFNNALFERIDAELIVEIKDGQLDLILDYENNRFHIIEFDLVNNTIKTDILILFINMLYTDPDERAFAIDYFRWVIRESEFYFINKENNYIFLYRSDDSYNNVVFNSTVEKKYTISRDFNEMLFYIDDKLTFQSDDTSGDIAIMIVGKHNYFFNTFTDYTYSYTIIYVRFYINSNLVKLENNPSKESIIEFLNQTNQIESE